MAKKQARNGRDGQRIALVLQGGGALGAYQVGVYQALAEHGYAPDWVAGTSIGSINGGIIAGNAPEDRLARLTEFWDTICRREPWAPPELPGIARQAQSAWSVAATVFTGAPGFFRPRPWNPFAFLPTGSAETASYYDTAPLRETLERLIDFDRLNSGATRFSAGAVHVRTGALRYFDNRNERIGPEHILASGALPPGFPAVEVEGEPYWDGGIYSNTPLEVVLDDRPRADTLCFMVALFNPAGPEPRSLAEVETRRKDIAYGTRAQQHIEAYCRTHDLRRAVGALYERLPDAARKDPKLRALAGMGCTTTMHIARIIYPTVEWEASFKDADFSRTAVEERLARGYRDATRMLERSPWLEPVPPYVGAVVHDLPVEGS